MPLHDLTTASNDPSRVLFLDIETTGIGHNDHPTVTGWCIDGEYNAHVHGDSIADLSADLLRASALVTFNGVRFDVPVLLKTYPHLPIPENHIDLMHVFWGLGYKGGLKKIEQDLGIIRGEETLGMSGLDAVRFWQLYKETDDQEHLDILTKYNRDDVLNMVHLLAFALSKHGHAHEPLLDVYGFDDVHIVRE